MRIAENPVGSRDLSSLIFLDESAKTISKVKAFQRGGRTARSISAEAEALTSPSAEEGVIISLAGSLANHSRNGTALCRHSRRLLPPNSDDIAEGYFFHYYVHSFKDRKSALCIEYGNGCLAASIKAVGTAGITRTSYRPSSSPEAHKQYLKAVQPNKAALQSRELARLCSRFLAINMLSVFESITGCHRSISSRIDHDGTASPWKGRAI